MKAKINKEQVTMLLEVLATKLNAPKNSEIRASLRRMLDNADLRELRDVMHLSGFKSVDYSFIKEDILRTQLEVDNLRMEDAACSTQIRNEEERFFIFCINAFYQIENITNYYFVKKFPNFPDLMKYMEEHSNFKHKENFKSEIVEKSVGDIDISCKIFALCGELFPSTEEQPDYTYKTINGLRFVRNEGFHRCQIDGKEINERLEKFYKFNDFITIRETLRKYVDVIKCELDLPQRIQEELDNYIALPHTVLQLSKEAIEIVTKAKLKHIISKDHKDNFWKIVISKDGHEDTSINVSEKYFVKRYGLADQKDMSELLPYIRIYYAIHKDYYHVWKNANNENKLDYKEPDVMKKYHIVKITKILEH